MKNISSKKPRAKAKPRQKKPPENPTTAYARAVTEGLILAGPAVRGECARHLSDLKDGAARGLTFDPERAQWAIDFFEDVLTVEADNKVIAFKLLDWQSFIVGSLFGWYFFDPELKKSIRRFRTAYVETGKGPLALDTPIPTPIGWKRMGNLSVGDYVFDQDGKPTAVVAVSPVFNDRECYRITWSDGSHIVADAEHKWPLYALRTGGKPGPKSKDAPRKGSVSKWSTKQVAENYLIKQTGETGPNTCPPKYNFASPVPAAFDCPPVDLPVPPYVFGLWLGDGNSDDARIACGDDDAEEMRKIVLAEGVPTVARGKQRYLLGDGDRSQAARNNSVQANLRALGVLGNKHIPALYMRAGVEQRRQVLRGLLDADGHATKKGNIELTLTSERLVNDAVELIRSLGYKATVSKGDAVLNGRVIGPRWRILFKAFSDDLPVFCLARKQGRLKPRPKTKPLSERRRIVSVERVASVPVKCITIAANSHVFLAGEGLIPTCNSGKSPLAAGVGLYCMIADGVASAEVYAAATIKSQAMILFKDATSMIRRSPDLADRLTSSGGNPVWQWTHIESASIFKPLSKDEAVSGPRPNCALIDEYHEHATADALEMLEAGFKGRESPLLFVITNSGKNKVTPCGDMHDYAYSVATGTFDESDQDAADRFFSYISMLDRDDDPFADEACWPKANPSLGHTIKNSYLRGRVNAARAQPSKQNDVLRLNFCRWTDSDTAWMTHDVYQRLLTKEDLRAKCAGMQAYAASDLSFTTDLTANATVIPYHVGEAVHYWAFVDFWKPREGLQASIDKDKVRYDHWADVGDLHLTEGKVIQLGPIADHYRWLQANFDLQAIAYDRYRHKELERVLRERGYEPPLIEHPQGFRRQMMTDPNTHKKVDNPLWMPGSCQELENAFVEGRITIQYNRVLNWNVSSAVVRHNTAGTGDWHFDKHKATARIDGLVALAMAVGAAKAGVTGEVVSDPWEDAEFSLVD